MQAIVVKVQGLWDGLTDTYSVDLDKSGFRGVLSSCDGSYPVVMEANEEITNSIVVRIRQCLNPGRIILFGSRARGDARSDSDFDILVVAESDLPRFRRSALIYSAVADLSCELDAVVYTSKEVEDWSGVPESLVSTALREGKVLYEAES